MGADAAATVSQTPDSENLYLFQTIDSVPVLEHGTDGHDFTTSKNPRVVEFYQPTCGACQAFKSNYVEVAKKVQAEKPGVEFYAVSCAAHVSLCFETYDAERVPKILVFPDDGGTRGGWKEVEKGSGAIYFVSQRILKALRSQEEIANDGLKIKNMDMPKQRRLTVADNDSVELPMKPVHETDGHSPKGGKGGRQYLKWKEDRDERLRQYQRDAVSGKGRPKAPREKIQREEPLKQKVEDFDAVGTGTKPNPEAMNESNRNPGAQKSREEFQEWVEKKDEGLRRDQREGEKKVNYGPTSIGNGRLASHANIQRKESRNEKNVDFNAIGTGSIVRNNDNLLRNKPLPGAAAGENNGEIASQKETRQVPPPPKRPARPVGGNSLTPNPFNKDPVKQKQFQEFVAKERQKMLRKEKMKHPVKALLGNKAQNKKIGDRVKNDGVPSPIQKQKSPAVSDPKKKTRIATGKKVADLRPEAQEKTTSQKILSKVPIVKRAFKRTKAEDMLNDAALSFTRGLLMGVFRKDPRAPLDYKRKEALKDWLDLLSVSLPPEMGLHELIDTLKYNIVSISQSLENLEMVVKKHKIPNPNWSDSCTSKSEKNIGFFCGFWKLLHIMSIGFAEQAGGLSLQESDPSVRVLSTTAAGDIVRSYMANFFNCDKCTQRFIAQYDDCSFDRCTRFSDETVNAPADSWREFPMWLWEIHNDVSRSKANRAAEAFDNLGVKGQAKKWKHNMNAVYPHIDQCVSCINADGTWDEVAVYNHLEKEYW